MTDIAEPITTTPVADQNTALIDALNRLSDSRTPEPTTAPSTLGTVGIAIIIFVLLVGAVVVIYFVGQQTPTFFAVSPFKYGDIINIRPAILTNNGSQDQYLRMSTSPNYNSGVGGTLEGRNMGSGASVLQFTGTRTQPESKWQLMQYSALPSDAPFDSNKSLLGGLGNRFYLRNTAFTSPTDAAARIRYQLMNQYQRGFCFPLSSPVIGAGDTTNNWFNAELLIYFMPTNYPDLYWLLFPTCSNTAAPMNYPDTTTQPNNGVISIKPWADMSQFGTSIHNDPNLCDSYYCVPENLVIDPFTNGVTSPFNNNVPIMNYLQANERLPPYVNPNVKLFKVTIA